MVDLVKRDRVKDLLLKVGVGLGIAYGLTSFVSAGVVQKVNGLNYIIGGSTEKNYGTINYDVNGYPTSIVVNNRTITQTYSSGVLVKVEDQNFKKDISYGASSTSWVTTKK